MTMVMILRAKTMCRRANESAVRAWNRGEARAQARQRLCAATILAMPLSGCSTLPAYVAAELQPSASAGDNYRTLPIGTELVKVNTDVFRSAVLIRKIDE